MMDDLDLIVCSALVESERTLGDSTIRDIKPSLSAAPAGEFNKSLLNAASNFLVLADKTRPVSNAELEHSVELLKSDPDVDFVLLFPPLDEDAVSTWQTGPALLAALRENVAQRVWAIVGRTSAVKELGFSDVSDPVWDFIIRASANSDRVRAIPLSNEIGIELAMAKPPTLALPELAPQLPGRSRSWLKSHLEMLSPEAVLPAVTSSADAIALKAGLFQIHDYLEASHELSQSVEGGGRHRAGDYWHAIMHRREPDDSNSKYWFRRVGSHPIFEELAKAANAIISQADTAAAESARQKLSLGSHWDPFAFVDFCEECNRKGDPSLAEIAKQIQWREMQLLLDQTYRDASGS